MEKELIYRILGIDKITDERALKMAYMEKLKVTNPEDDPEGFKRLREAYEKGIEHLRTVEDAGEQEKTAIDLWIGKMDAIYQDFGTRGDKEIWKDLLADEVCKDLDTSMEARNAAIRYLMSHSYLPMEIWQCIDREFEIVADIEQLKESFPEQFLEYIKCYTQNPYWVDFKRFKKRQNAENMNVDAYIRTYLEVRNLYQCREFEKAWEKFQELSVYGVWYPLEELEKMRLLEAAGKMEEAGKMADSLVAECEKEESVYWSDRKYILPSCGNVKWNLGEKEKAFQLWEKVPQDRDSKFGMMKFYLEEEETAQKAKEIAMGIWKLDGGPQNIRKYLTQANEIILVQLERKRKEAGTREELDEILLEMAWCYYQEEKTEKTMELLEAITPGEDTYYDYHNLKARVLTSQERHAEAIPELRLWLSMILETTDDGSEKVRERLERKGMAYSMLGYCLLKEKEYEEAMVMLQHGETETSDWRQKMHPMYNMAELFLETQQYEQAAEKCDQILRMEPRHYYAILLRQEACYRIQRVQQVIDDYYNAIRIYPGNIKPYFWAVQTFVDYHRYKDAKEILDRVKEAKLELTDTLKLLEIRILRNLAESKEERTQILKQLEALMKEVKVAETDLEDISELVFEMSMLHWNNGDREQGLQHMGKAININRDRKDYVYVFGCMYMDMGKYEEALKWYQAVKEEHEEDANFWHYVGYCCDRLGLRHKMVEHYKKALELDPELTELNQEIAEYYNDKYTDTCDPQDYEKALYYINRAVELEEGIYQLMCRAGIYMDGYRYKEAIAEFQRVLEMEPDKWNAYNNMALCYQYQGDFEQAKIYFDKAIAIVEAAEEKESTPYKNLAKLYQILDEYGKAEEYWFKVIERDKEEVDAYEEIGQLYFGKREYRKAISYYKEYSKRGGNRGYLFYIGDCYAVQNRLKRAKLYYEMALTNLNIDFVSMYKFYTDYAQRMNSIFEYRSAIRGLEEMEKLVAGKKLNISTWEQGRHWDQKAQAYYMMRMFEKAAECAGKAREIILTGVKSEEAFLEYGKNFPLFLSLMGGCYLYLGEVQKAFSIFEQMPDCRRCLHCRYRKCYDGFVYMGYYYEVTGQSENALLYYRKAQEVDPNHIEMQLRIKKLENS